MTEFPETPLTTENPYNDKIDQELFNNTMKGQWNKVVEAYKNNSHAQVARITRSGDTALHRAVSDSETKIALELLEFVQPKALKNMSNEQGNTPLHLAAALGNLEICKKVLSKNVRVIGARNRDGETPLFIAALHGKEDVFFFLYGFVKEVTDEQYLRRSNGDTVLHVAISFEFFRMAFTIIQLRPDFVDCSNEYGLSPLHILASKPDAFKSSTRLGRFDRITYSCLLVVANDDKEAINSTSGEKKNKDPYPENSTRAEGFGVVQAKKILGFSKNTRDKENPQESTNTTDEENPNERSRFVREESGFLVLFFKLIWKTLLVILRFACIWRLEKIYRKKSLHIWAKRVMDELVKCTNSYNILEHGGETPRRISFDAFDGPRFIDHEYLDHDFLFGKKEEYLDYEPNSDPRRMMVVEQKIDLPRKRPSPLLVAAKMGVREMVEKILDEYPVAIEDSDQEGKNVVLLAIENRHPQVYIFLKEKYSKKPYIFQKIDTQGNSALHMAAHLQGNWSWRIPRSVVQMHQEIKWYKFVESSMPQDFFFRRNKKGKTPKEVFIETHGQLIKDVNEWLNRISEACSVVAALVASVAFATAAAVPGGTKPEGVPTLEGKPAFNVFGLASVVAFCSSVTSLVFFLSLLASRYQYALDFPLKLFLGFTTLFVSIASMMVSFLSGNLFVLDDGLRHVAYLLYAALCLPLIYLALRQLSLYLDLLGSILLKLPKYSQL